MGIIDRHFAIGLVAAFVSLLLLVGGVVPASADVEELPISPQDAAQPADESVDEGESSSPEEPTSPEPSNTQSEADAEGAASDPTETPSPSAPTEEPGDDTAVVDEAAEEPKEETSEPPASEEDELAPFAVPAPESREAVITVNVGGDRTSDTSVGDLAGVTLRLHDGGSDGPGAPINEDWATCVSDSDGDCSFTIPDTQWGIPDWGRGANYDRRFWVVAQSAPLGWYLNEELVTGGPTNQGTTKYAFRTGMDREPFQLEAGVRAGRTYGSGQEFMDDSWRDAGWWTSYEVTDSGGHWQASKINPRLQQTCEAGLDVALVLDLSASVSDAGALDSLQKASQGVAEALSGSGSSLALYTFGTSAPVNSNDSGRNYASMPIDEGNNLRTIKNRIDGYQTGAGNAGGTNWDRGIYQVAESKTNYDLAIVVTDGMPTFYGPGHSPSGPGNNTRLIEVEQAIFSANALKSQGTRVLAVGVGAGVNGGAANLRAISGQTSYASAQSAHEADYFQTGWSQLADLLEEVVRGATCQANIEITKETTAYGEDAPSSGGAGWQFTATATGGSITPGATQSTGDDGQVAYTLQFETPRSQPAVLTIEEALSSEQADSGWALEDIDCTLNGADVTVGDANADITVAVGDDVACTFHNVEKLVPKISIEKQGWTTSNADGLDGAEQILNGDPVTNGSTITWTYTVSNTGETLLEDIQVTDDQLAEDAVICPRDSLEPDESMECTASGAVTAGS